MNGFLYLINMPVLASGVDLHVARKEHLILLSCS